MKILMSGRFVAPSGVARATREFTIAFRKHNLEDELVVFAFADKSSREICGNTTIQTMSVRPDLVHVPIRGLGTIYELRSRYAEQMRSAVDLLYETEPDVIVVNGTNVHDWILMEAARELRVPKVAILHSAFAERLKYVDTPQQRLLADIETQIVEQSSSFVFVSPLVRNLFAVRYGITPECHVVIPNGIPDVFFSLEDRKENLFDIGFIGRDDPVKNLEFVRDLSGHSISRGRTIHVLSDFAHNAALEPDLRKNGVYILPPTTDDVSLHAIYQATRLVVSPSHFETLGLVPVEALACGSAAVISKHMGIAYYFKQLGLNDWVIDFGDTERAIKHILELLSSSLCVCDTIRQQLKENYAWSVTSRRFIEFFMSGTTKERAPEKVRVVDSNVPFFDSTLLEAG
ncbi:TPA: glycosyltransferase family 4 protein [Candidatus Micrarchaeota archaeon]|nr:glycosyltransferase family 4 protein [Candidatus Micrarchaeota archaeon]